MAASAPARAAASSRSTLLSRTRSAQPSWSPKQLLERAVVVERRIRRRAEPPRRGIGGEQAGGGGRAVDHGDHPVDGDARAHLRPVERLHQRLRQRRPEVSMTMWSGGSARLSSFSMVGRKSSATVQQMQPLASSTISPSLQAGMPQLRSSLAVDGRSRRTR